MAVGSIRTLCYFYDSNNVCIGALARPIHQVSVGSDIPDVRIGRPLITSTCNVCVMRGVVKLKSLLTIVNEN